MPIPPLPAPALRDLLGVIRVVWWVRWAAGGDEAELRAIASVGDDVRRLVRAARFEACVTTWHQTRLAMGQVVRLGEVVPWAEPMLRAGSSRILAVKGIPPPPLHAFAAPTGERPPPEMNRRPRPPEEALDQSMGPPFEELVRSTGPPFEELVRSTGPPFEELERSTGPPFEELERSTGPPTEERDAGTGPAETCTVEPSREGLDAGTGSEGP